MTCWKENRFFQCTQVQEHCHRHSWTDLKNPGVAVQESSGDKPWQEACPFQGGEYRPGRKWVTLTSAESSLFLSLLPHLRLDSPFFLIGSQMLMNVVRLWRLLSCDDVRSPCGGDAQLTWVFVFSRTSEWGCCHMFFCFMVFLLCIRFWKAWSRFTWLLSGNLNTSIIFSLKRRMWVLFSLLLLLLSPIYLICLANH